MTIARDDYGDGGVTRVGRRGLRKPSQHRVKRLRQGVRPESRAVAAWWGWPTTAPMLAIVADASTGRYDRVVEELRGACAVRTTMPMSQIAARVTDASSGSSTRIVAHRAGPSGHRQAALLRHNGGGACRPLPKGSINLDR